MELRRFEALANLSQGGNTKVIFDLAKPYDDMRHVAATMAEAAATEPSQMRVKDAGEGALRTASQQESEAIAEAEAALEGARQQRIKMNLGVK
jgi:hypothetical protein